MRGTLAFEPVKVACCGLCRRKQAVRPPKRAGGSEGAYAAEARRMGWRRTKKHGWVCKKHRQREWS